MPKPWGENPKTISITRLDSGPPWYDLSLPQGTPDAGEGTSGGTNALSWSAPDGLAVGNRLIIETDGTYDLGTGPDYWFFEDFGDLSEGSYPTSTNSAGVTAEQTREDAPNAVRTNASLLEDAFSRDRALSAWTDGAGRNAFSVYVPDAGGPNGKKLFTEWYASYALRHVGDLRASDGEPYLGNSKPIWLVLGGGFSGAAETADAGNDMVLYSNSGGLDGGTLDAFSGNNTPGGGVGNPRQWNFDEWNVDSGYARLINPGTRQTHEQVVWGARTAVSDYRRLISRGIQTSDTILKTQQGAAEYDSGTTYNTGDVVWHPGIGGQSGKNWRSLIDNNTTSPADETGDWADEGLAYPQGQPAAWDEIRVSGYFDNRLGSDIQESIMDHVQINIGANSFSRVMLTDARNYDVATKETACKPISWTNNKIEVEIRQGLLDAIDGAAVQVALPDLSFLNLRLSGTPLSQGMLTYAQHSITTEERSYLTANGSGLILLSFSIEDGSGSASEVTALTVGGQTATRIGREVGGSAEYPSTEVWAVAGLAAGEHEVVATLNKTDSEAALFASFYETSHTTYSSTPIGTFNGNAGGGSVWSFNATTTNDNSEIFVAMSGEFNETNLFGFDAGIVSEVVKTSGGGGSSSGIGHATGSASTTTAGSYTLDFENTGGNVEATAIAVELSGGA